MTNDELATAISAAHNRAGLACETQRVHLEHLKELLSVQLGRAREVVMNYHKENNALCVKEDGK